MFLRTDGFLLTKKEGIKTMTFKAKKDSNVRFWTHNWVHPDSPPVKITLKPGQSLSHGYGAGTDEHGLTMATIYAWILSATESIVMAGYQTAGHITA